MFAGGSGGPLQVPPGPVAQRPMIVIPQARRPVVPPAGQVLTGTVKSYSARGYGFILCDEMEHDVYFAKECLQAGLRTANIAGTVVDFELMRGVGGRPQASYLRPQAGALPLNFANAGPRSAAAFAAVASRAGATGLETTSAAPPVAPFAHTPPPNPGVGGGFATAPSGFSSGSGFSSTPPPQTGFTSGFSSQQPFRPPSNPGVPPGGVFGAAGAPGMGGCGCPGMIPPGVNMAMVGGRPMMMAAGRPGFPAGFPASFPPGMVRPPMPGMPMSGMPIHSAHLGMMGARPPQRNLSPHAGSRAIAMARIAAAAAQKSQAAAGGKKEGSSSRSSSRKSSSSSSSAKKKKKKKGKKKKKKSSSSESASSGGRDRSRSRARGAAAKGDDEEELSNPEVDAAKKEALEKLQSLRSLAKDDRMKEFRGLLRAWHPDKNPDRAEVATAVFQFLQKGKSLLDVS